ncbi:MAG: RNA-binding S4 domain-containing protein [Candidatus Marinimicrobia bacterium]|nr:RNA-binding S4 domain-containing protein [Candidatus Neomarinimicrobiota bacterium]MBL7023083.1 RNA-binding S4 domain-containing protein [Candidatus Neomarinimicrobiota bacterium]MBL7109103.1 RNA-binding S4 domain-containing protein [Candidatus Neomarinimicrobiota bacterium]
MSSTQIIRIDKWLWAVRIYKTRSMATDACHSGKVKIGGKSVKPSRQIRIGEIISVQKDYVKRQYKVLGLIEKRGSAKIASENVEDITPEEELIKLKTATSIPVAKREKGKGRPTKKERRQMGNIKW